MPRSMMTSNSSSLLKRKRTYSDISADSESSQHHNEKLYTAHQPQLPSEDEDDKHSEEDSGDEANFNHIKSSIANSKFSPAKSPPNRKTSSHFVGKQEQFDGKVCALVMNEKDKDKKQKKMKQTLLAPVSGKKSTIKGSKKKEKFMSLCEAFYDYSKESQDSCVEFPVHIK